MRPERTDHVVGPGVGADHEAARRHPAGGRLELHTGRRRAYGAHGAGVPQHRPLLPGEVLQDPRAAAGRHDGGVALVQHERALGQPELRPALAHVVDAQHVVLDADRGQGVDVVGRGDGRVRREEVEPADHRHQLLAGGALEVGPVGVRLLRQPHVGRACGSCDAGSGWCRGWRRAGGRARSAPAPARGGRAGPAARRWRCRARPARPRRSRSARSRPAAGRRRGLTAARSATGGCRGSRPPWARTSPGGSRARSCRAAPTRRSPSPGG